MFQIFQPLIDLVSIPFAYLLRFFNNITGSYVVAIFLFAIVMKLVLLPFAINQQKTQIKGAKLRPKMAAIEKKYAGRTDQKTMQKKQEELMELQKEEGYSPLSGCLPMLIQFPIIIVLYTIIQNPLTNILGWSKEFIQYNVHHWIPEGAVRSNQIATLVHLMEKGLTVPAEMIGEAFGGITLESGEAVMDKLMHGIDLGFYGLTSPDFFGRIPWDEITKNHGYVYILIPILVALSSYGSMWLTRKLTAGGIPQQTQGADSKISKIIMDLMMPATSMFFAFTLPAMLGIYWIFQSLLGVLQQFILSKAMPLPKYTDEEIRAILKAEKERDNANRAAMREARASSKSLHHIDDEDDDEDIVIPEIKSKFDEDDTDEPSAPKENAPKDTQPQQKKHLRQAKKKK